MYKVLLIAVLSMMVSVSAGAQKKNKSRYHDIEHINPESFGVWKGNALKKTKRVFIPRTSIHFKTTTNSSVVFGKGTKATTVGAWANLQGISEETRQALTDEFYDYLTSGVKNLGIEIVDYDKFLGASGYAKFSDKQIDRELSNKTFGVNEIYTYKNGPHTKPLGGNIGIWGATSKLCKELDANALIVDVTLDFTRFEINFKKDKSVFYNAGFVNGYSYDKVYTNSKAKSAAIPQIIIRANNGAGAFGESPTGAFITDAKKLATHVYLLGEFKANGEFATGIEAYKGKLPEGMRRTIRIGAHMDTGTYIITADDALFRVAASAALKKYADGLLAAMKSTRQ